MSVFVRVTPSGLALDGDDLYRVATSLDSAARSAQSALASTGGMAGNEESAQEFIDGYGEGAVNSLDAAGSYAQALRALDTLLGDTANAYTDAGTIGTLETVATRSPSATPGSAATFTVPSAKAPGAIGPLGEFQEFVMDALAQIGVVLPDADSGKLGEAASAWSAYSTAITNAANELDGTLTNLAAMDIPQGQNIRDSRDSIAEKLREIATGATGLADLCSEQQKNVDAMWEEIGWFLAQMAAEIALEAGLGIALTALTGGMAAPAVIAKIATTVMRWVVKIGNLVKRLVTLTRAQAIAAKILLKGLKEGTQSAIATVTVQAAVNHIRGPEHAQSLLAVGLGSFAGGAIGGRVGDGGAHVLRIERRSGISRVALNTAVGSGEGAVDGLTDGLVQSGVTGSPFDPISSAGLGAIIGGVARPVGGGTRPNAPSAGSGGGNSTSSPDGVDVPASSTPDSPLGPTGVDTPSAPSPNTPAAPQGSGGAPSSAAPAAAGANPDAPDAPIVDGAGDATTPVDSSGSVDIPAGDAPTGAGADTSTSTNSPGVPDVSAPSGDGGTPSLPDSSPSMPDSSTPSMPDSSTPSTPDSSAPSTPDSSAPSTPDTTPSTPDATPSTPDSSAPSTPDTTPSTPDATPSTPDSSAPSTPDASAPSTPDASTPDTSPSTPDSSTPSTPDTAPSTPDTSPSTPDSTTPSTPDSTAPSTPDSNAPSAPDTTPSTPDATPGNGSPSTAPVAGASPSSPSTSTPDANTSVDSSSFDAAVAADAADASTPDGTTPDGTTPDGTTPESDATTPDDTVDPDALDAGDAAAGTVAAGAVGAAGLHAGATGSSRPPSTPSTPNKPPRFNANLVAALSPESQSIVRTVDSEGRTFRDNELDVLNADAAVREAVRSNLAVRRRVTLRAQVRLNIIDDADRNSDGDLLARPDDTVIPCRRDTDGSPILFDPETGRRVAPGEPGMTMPEPGTFDFGHAPGHQWRDTRIIATLENGWDRPRVIRHENTEDHYRLETPSENRSNRNNRRA